MQSPPIFKVHQFDSSTFVVTDVAGNEIAICAEYDSNPVPAESRAILVAAALNFSADVPQED